MQWIDNKLRTSHKIVEYARSSYYTRFIVSLAKIRSSIASRSSDPNEGIKSSTNYSNDAYKFK